MEDHRAAGRCAYPPELDEIDLIAAADDESTADVLAHLTDCPHCAARLEAIVDLQLQLRQRLYRLFCPTSDELAAFSEGEMIPEERERVSGHLAECSRCRAELVLFEQFTAIPSDRPPASSLQQVVAHPTRPPFGWPSGVLTEGMIYRAGNLRVVLHLERQRGARRPRLRGVLSGAGHQGLTASLLSKGHVITSASLDPVGEFILDDVATGSFTLSVRLPNYEVLVEGLHIL